MNIEGFRDLDLQVGDVLQVTWLDKSRFYFTVVQTVSRNSVGGHWTTNEEDAVRYQKDTPTSHNAEEFISITIVKRKGERKVDRVEFWMECR